MFARNFKVKGEDVNDFMVMENASFLRYSSKIVEVFLLENGFSKLKLNSLKIGWQKSNDRLINQKRLMFTETFSVQLNIISSTSFEGNKKLVTVDFYNNRSELSATLITEICWFDYTTWETITPPKKIAQFFTETAKFKKAV
tara:strand:+ start:27356 stop:27781 length:426 start_codon:yes stop_codon:yes gene_type:complete